MSVWDNTTILIQECIARNREAQKALYDKYAPTAYSLIKRYTRHDELAAEMLNEPAHGRKSPVGQTTCFPVISPFRIPGQTRLREFVIILTCAPASKLNWNRCFRNRLITKTGSTILRQRKCPNSTLSPAIPNTGNA